MSTKMRKSQWRGESIDYYGGYFYVIKLSGGDIFPVTLSQHYVDKCLRGKFIPENVHLSEDGKHIVFTDKHRLSLLRLCTYSGYNSGSCRCSDGAFFSRSGISPWEYTQVVDLSHITQHSIQLEYADNFVGTVTFSDVCIDTINGWIPHFRECMDAMEGLYIDMCGSFIFARGLDAMGTDHLRDDFDECKSHRVFRPVFRECRAWKEGDIF